MLLKNNFKFKLYQAIFSEISIKIKQQEQLKITLILEGDFYKLCRTAKVFVKKEIKIVGNKFEDLMKVYNSCILTYNKGKILILAEFAVNLLFPRSVESFEMHRLVAAIGIESKEI